MSHHDYSLEELSDITPYENYITAIRDKVTKKKYAGQLEMFLNPDYDWDKSQQKRKLLPEKIFASIVLTCKISMSVLKSKFQDLNS